MKKTFIGLLLTAVTLPAFSGGLLTNTNQSIAFVRMMSRGAAIDIDAVYSNPAGLGFLPRDGFYFSFNWQSAYQTRNIDATFPLFPETGNRRYYKGTASAPVLPTLYGAYKKGDWTFSGFAGVVGGGGKASFDSGLPMFDSQVMAGLAANTTVQSVQSLVGVPAASDLYDIATAMEGRQFIYGLQFGATYKAAEWLSIYAGARMNYFTGGYKGYVTAKAKPALLQNPTLQAVIASNPGLAALATQPLVDLQLDVNQTGWGLAPILGVDIKTGKFNFGLKYEFMTNLNIENDTKKNSDPEGALAAFKDGVNTPSDVPALFTAAMGYELTRRLRASVEYHHYFDKQAEMASNKQEYLEHGTNEYQIGAEFDVTKRLSVSAGYQRTDYGLADNYQSDTSFSCDSYSVGFGGVYRVNDRIKINVGYFWTTYSDYKKDPVSYPGIPLTGTNVYSRTNKVFGAGIDFVF